MDPVHLLHFGMLIMASLVPFYMAFKLRSRRSRPLLLLPLLLAIFSVTHSFYHLAEYLDEFFIADVYLLPLSTGMFSLFALYYWRHG